MVPIDSQDDSRKALTGTPAPSHVIRRRVRIFQAGLAATLVAFGVLAFFARQSAYFPLDLRITQAVQGLDAPFLAGWMNLVSWFGYAPQAYLLTASIVLLLIYVGRRWEGLNAALAAFASGTLNTIVKVLIHRPRPTSDLVQAVRSMDSYSFPSGHVMYYTAFFGFLFYLAFTRLKHSWARTLLLVFLGAMVLLIGVSRVYRGEHWASDVLGAYLLGTLVLSAVIRVYQRPWGR